MDDDQITSEERAAVLKQYGPAAVSQIRNTDKGWIAALIKFQKRMKEEEK